MGAVRAARRDGLTTTTLVFRSAQTITKVGAEIHEYEPIPDDLVRAEGADLVLENGLGLERWFRRFVERAGVSAVTVSSGVVPIPISVGSYQGQANPHAWMSPRAGAV